MFSFLSGNVVFQLPAEAGKKIHKGFPFLTGRKRLIINNKRERFRLRSLSLLIFPKPQPTTSEVRHEV